MRIDVELARRVIATLKVSSMMVETGAAVAEVLADGPSILRYLADTAREHYHIKERCIYCDVLQQEIDDRELAKIEGIIHSMTRQERQDLRRSGAKGAVLPRLPKLHERQQQSGCLHQDAGSKQKNDTPENFV